MQWVIFKCLIRNQEWLNSLTNVDVWCYSLLHTRDWKPAEKQMLSRYCWNVWQKKLSTAGQKNNTRDVNWNRSRNEANRCTINESDIHLSWVESPGSRVTCSIRRVANIWGRAPSSLGKWVLIRWFACLADNAFILNHAGLKPTFYVLHAWLPLPYLWIKYTEQGTTP